MKTSWLRLPAAVVTLSVVVPALASAKFLRVPQNFKSIQEAVDAAVPGDTVLVSVSTARPYYEPFVVSTNDLVVRAADGHSPVVTNTASFTPTILVAADHVKIQGFTTTAPPFSSTLGIVVSGNSNVIVGNFANKHLEGFRNDHGHDNTFGNNVSSSNAYGFVDIAGDGAQFLGNLATGCTFNGFYSGPFALPCTHSLYAGNEASGCGNEGFRFRGLTESVLEDNLASHCGKDGYLLTDACIGVRVRDNDAIGNGGDGFSVELGSDGNAFRRNSAVDNGGYGYYIEDLLGNVFRNNQADGNTNGDSNGPKI